MRPLFWLAFLLMALVIGGGCETKESPLSGDGDTSASGTWMGVDGRPQAAAGGRRSHRNPVGSYGEGLRYLRAPKMRELALPTLHGAESIWGATGRDLQGNIYFGVAGNGVEDPTARLLQYIPREDRIENLGAVNDELENLSLRRKDPFAETQMKIHSKIFEAADGRIYFSSQDEHEEQDDGSKPPLFGGRLFAWDPLSKRWDCILTVPEGLIAVAAGSRHVYAMGYFGHVIYQYDLISKSVRSIALGTYRGHISRNFFVDDRDHVFAVRLTDKAALGEAGVTQVDGVGVLVTLVELDNELNQVSEWPLDDYQPTGDSRSHGMTGYARLLDGSIVFVTHSGALWHVVFGSQSTRLDRLGWVHPDGSSYCATLFSPMGKDYVMGFTNQPGQPHEWFVFDLRSRQSTILRLDLKSQEYVVKDKLLLYGCDTLDDMGRAYVVGWKQSNTRFVPFASQLTWGD